VGVSGASRHQDVDDMICRPANFIRTLSDGTVEKTFGVRNAFHINTQKLGELIVWESPAGSFIKITEEPQP
jgi:hypothetical protein